MGGLFLLPKLHPFSLKFNFNLTNLISTFLLFANHFMNANNTIYKNSINRPT